MDSSRKLAPMQHIELCCRPEKVFENSCLPSTMGLAARFHADLLLRLASIEPGWPFEDRVLVWLLPNLERDSRAFHSGNGGNLASMFAEHQLAHIDEALTGELLRRLDEQSPLTCKV